MKNNAQTKLIAFRLTQQDYDNILEKSKSCGLSISTFIRNVLLGYNPPATFSNEELSFANMLFEAITDVKKFNSAFKEFTKNMTQEERNKVVLNARTINDWGISISSVIDFFEEYKKHINK